MLLNKHSWRVEWERRKWEQVVIIKSQQDNLVGSENTT
jgi:hypothetical protein